MRVFSYLQSGQVSTRRRPILEGCELSCSGSHHGHESSHGAESRVPQCGTDPPSLSIFRELMYDSKVRGEEQVLGGPTSSLAICLASLLYQSGGRYPHRSLRQLLHGTTGGSESGCCVRRGYRRWDLNGVISSARGFEICMNGGTDLMPW